MVPLPKQRAVLVYISTFIDVCLVNYISFDARTNSITRRFSKALFIRMMYSSTVMFRDTRGKSTVVHTPSLAIIS